jgi:hypothetical protein
LIHYQTVIKFRFIKSNQIMYYERSYYHVYKNTADFKCDFGSGLLIALGAMSVFAAPQYSSRGPAASIESISDSSLDLNTTSLDGCPILSRDGLQLYMASNRPGGVGAGNLDIWVAGRATANGPFGAPVNMGQPINSEYNDFCPSPLRDGQGFMFVSNRPGGCGGADIYLTRYNPVRGGRNRSTSVAR